MFRGVGSGQLRRVIESVKGNRIATAKTQNRSVHQPDTYREHVTACVAIKKATRSRSVRRDRAADRSGDLGGIRSVELFAAGRRGLQFVKKDARAHSRRSIVDS